MRVLFIWPGITLPGFGSLHVKRSNEATYVSHGYMSMSAVLRQRGHEPTLLDMRDCLGWSHFEQCLAKANYDMVAIGFLSCDHDTAKKVCAIAKNLRPHIPIVAGGLHLTATKSQSFPYVDTVVWGEGDYALSDLADTLQRGETLPAFVQTPLVENLDDLPFVDRTLFDDVPERNNPLLPGLPIPNVTIITSRGCNFRCKFCFPSGLGLFGSKMRHRSVENVMTELLEIKNSRGPIGSIMWHSDVFGDEQWLETFVERFGATFYYIPFWCQLRADFICKRPDLIHALSEVGMYWVSLGLESGSDRMLKFLRKGATVEMNRQAADILQGNQINIFANMIVGAPSETPEEMRQSLALAAHVKPAWWSANCYVSFPGSDLYDYVIENNLLTDEDFGNWVYPYQKKIRGLDYQYIQDIQAQIRAHSRPVYPVKKSPFQYLEPRDVTVSVVMRSYNRPEMLSRAVQSILNQTMDSWELIIIDDASTDPLMEEVFMRVLHPRIRIVRNEKNADGHCIRLNQGIDYARGKYIAFCDDDDTRDPDWLEQMVSFLETHPSLLYVLCPSKDVNDKEPSIKRGKIPKSIAQICEGNMVDLGEMVVRRQVFDLVGMFDERLRYGDDWEFAARLVKAGIPGGEVSVPLCSHYVHLAGQLTTRTQAQRDFTKAIIHTKVVSPNTRVAVYWPQESRLQHSQWQVVAGVRDALLRIPHVSVVAEGHTDSTPEVNPATCDFVFIVCPFQCTLTELQGIQDMSVPMVALHTEDPPALNSNLTNSVYFDWVITNDESTIPYYHQRAKRGGTSYDPSHVGFMPCISVNTAVTGPPRHRVPDPKYDMIICGYMYDSRRDWLKRVADKIDWNLLLVGRRWEQDFNGKFEILGDQGLAETQDLYANSKIICCLHRLSTDDGTQVSFSTACRGYVESYSGALVMMDNTRKVFPPFEQDELMLFDYRNPDNFIDQAHRALKSPELRSRIGEKAQRRSVEHFTYTSRMSKLIRALRGPRQDIRIP